MRTPDEILTEIYSWEELPRQVLSLAEELAEAQSAELTRLRSQLEEARRENERLTSGAPTWLDDLEELRQKATRPPLVWAASKDGEDTLEIVRKALSFGERPQLHSVGVSREPTPDDDHDFIYVAMTGNGPTSPANARYLAALWNTAEELIARARQVASLQSALTECEEWLRRANATAVSCDELAREERARAEAAEAKLAESSELCRVLMESSAAAKKRAQEAPRRLQEGAGVKTKLCKIPAKTLPPCDLEWGHEGDMHANCGDGFYARDYLDEHHRRQVKTKRRKARG